MATKKKFEDWIPTSSLPSSRSVDDFEQKNSILFEKYIAVDDFYDDLIEDINNDEDALFVNTILNQKNDSEILDSGLEWFEEGPDDDQSITIDNDDEDYLNHQCPDKEYELYLENKDLQRSENRYVIEQSWLEQWNTDNKNENNKNEK